MYILKRSFLYIFRLAFINELQKNLKSCEGRIVKLQSLLSDYEKRFSVDNTVLILKDLLPHDFQAKSYEEVYKQLTVQEKKSFDDNDYRLCKQILAAKYMILEIM